jgi:hypothetical protein
MKIYLAGRSLISIDGNRMSEKNLAILQTGLKIKYDSLSNAPPAGGHIMLKMAARNRTEIRT